MQNPYLPKQGLSGADYCFYAGMYAVTTKMAICAFQVEVGGCKASVTTFIVEPFVPHDQEFYLSMVSERLGCTISFSECGGIEIEENWDKVCHPRGSFGLLDQS